MTSFHLALLRGAAWMVPGAERAEWLAEWRAELWYVDRGATRFCLGAFRDALWLRRNRNAPNSLRAFGLESPVRCVLALAALAAASVFLAFRLPLPRRILLPAPYRDALHLAMISADGQRDAPGPTVTIEQYRRLANRMHKRFTGLAFYRPIKARVPGAELSIAVASANLFELLQIPISGARENALVLSDTAWRKYFAGDAHIVGRALLVAGQPAVIAGVIPASSWRLPGRVDAWLLAAELHVLARSQGFVLGHLRQEWPGEPEWQWRLSAENEQGGNDRFVCSSLGARHYVPEYCFLFLLSLLLLTAFTPLALGEYPANRRMRLRRWSFLGIKLALVLPIVFFGSLDLASLVSMEFQPHGMLAGLILGLRWVLADQRRRCPVCLRLVANPIRIGRPSEIYLAWYGTEFICTHGHGLLYVPEIATSCYSAPRWQYLDPSWSSLFS
jgi:hypothetical protein